MATIPGCWLFVYSRILVSRGRYRSALEPLRMAYQAGYCDPAGRDVVRRAVAGLGERPFAAPGVCALLDASGARS